MAERGLILDDEGRMVIRNGTFLEGETTTQEVALLMVTCKGELKDDVFCGCDLLRRTNSRLTVSQLHSIVRLQVERDGKDWSAIKNGINLRANG